MDDLLQDKTIDKKKVENKILRLEEELKCTKSEVSSEVIKKLQLFGKYKLIEGD